MFYPLNSNKKRKYCEKMVEDELLKYQAAVKDIVSKFNAKRDSRSKKVMQLFLIAQYVILSFYINYS